MLETKSLRHVGGDDEVKVDVRIVAATNRDLKREMQDNHFRKDLFFRLGTTLHVPPLREHLEDIPALVEHFLARLTVEYRRRLTLSESALQRLQTLSLAGQRPSIALRCWRRRWRRRKAASSRCAASIAFAREQPSPAPIRTAEAESGRTGSAGHSAGVAQTRRQQHADGRLLGIHRDTLIYEDEEVSASSPPLPKGQPHNEPEA